MSEITEPSFQDGTSPPDYFFLCGHTSLPLRLALSPLLSLESSNLPRTTAGYVLTSNMRTPHLAIQQHLLEGERKHTGHRVTGSIVRKHCKRLIKDGVGEKKESLNVQKRFTFVTGFTQRQCYCVKKNIYIY